MKIDKLLEKILKEKQALVESCKLCTKSIDFWEKKANILFDKMDEAEKEFELSTDEYIEDTCSNQLKEIEVLMKRMQFENDQLDELEAQVVKLEIKLCDIISEHAQKQKK
tara:strand:- start:564 stop:893 length:330 start_codon:yes stop_codon:yes gene_type:complete